MSRSWREERKTPKEPRKDTPRPRVSDFAREYYQGKGYQVEVPEDTMTLLPDDILEDWYPDDNLEWELEHD